MRSLALPLLCTLIAVAIPARASAPADGRLLFTVLRGGDEIGHHEMQFRREGDALDVNIQTHVEVKVLFVTAYRFEHTAHERWKDARLVTLDSTTNDDGAKHQLHAEADAGALKVVADGQERLLEGPIIPASLWHEGVVRGGRLLNTLDGRSMTVSVQDLGPDTVRARGQDVPARRYRLTGDLERELWYNTDSVLVQVRFAGKDGSEVRYELR